MRTGTPFEVSKEVYERAKGDRTEDGYYYVKEEDQKELFSESIRWGYGLYNCRVHKEGGKYICTWERGETCD